jgi:hypothetical protein
MGVHWIDPASHEFHGHDFTATVLYGSYNGEMNFIEPMITRAYSRPGPRSRRRWRSRPCMRKRAITRRSSRSGSTRRSTNTSWPSRVSPLRQGQAQGTVTE